LQALSCLYMVFTVPYLFASHQGRSDRICISTCTKTDMQKVLQDTHISYTTGIALLCNASLIFSKFFSPLLVTLLCCFSSFSARIYCRKRLVYEKVSIIPVLTLHTPVPWL